MLSDTSKNSVRAFQGINSLKVLRSRSFNKNIALSRIIPCTSNAPTKAPTAPNLQASKLTAHKDKTLNETALRKIQLESPLARK